MAKVFFIALVLLLSISTSSSSRSVSSVNFTVPTALPTQTPTPSPIHPLTFDQLNQQYGPCTHLPVLMYHHIQPQDQAQNLHQTSLTVFTPFFKKHLEYLRDHGYTVISANTLLNYFIHKEPLPTKSVLLTFDDGYANFYSDALPILKEFGYPSVLFVSTGLVGNPGYLTWSQIIDMSRHGQVYIGNHTWSHHNLSSPDHQKNLTEISTAENQILDHGLTKPLLFAYPYGSYNQKTTADLSQSGYQASFTTKPGTIQCHQLRYSLTRLRPGNFPLSQLSL